MVKNLPANEGDAGWFPGSGRSPGEGNGNPLQENSLLENSMDRGTWWSTVHGVTKRHDLTTKQLQIVKLLALRLAEARAQ